MKERKSNKKITGKQLIIFAIALVAYFFFMKSKSQIINYPNFIYYILFLTLITIWIILKYREWSVSLLKLSTFKQRLIFFSVELIKLMVIFWFLAGIILVPFNYYNIYTAKKNKLNTVYCEITGISTYSQNRSIFYIFNGRTNTMYGYNELMDEIKDDAKYKNYYFVANVREGILDSYIIETWSIQKK